MIKSSLIYISVFIISTVIICFEIISTRISSVIFVHNYAFIILSFSIMGLGLGGIFSYYKIKVKSETDLQKVLKTVILWIGISLSIFIISIVKFNFINPYIFIFLLTAPFFLAGILFSQIFKQYSGDSFTLYAADLSGAAIGSLLSLVIFKIFSAENAVLFLSLALIATTNIFKKKSFYTIGSLVIIFLFMLLLAINGKCSITAQIPIGNYPEKDFYYVYDDPNVISTIIDSRWSNYGRADLVSYNHQDIVRHLFIDGAAGTQMFRFNGEINNPGRLLSSILMRNPTTMPLLWLDEKEKDNMLVIGPGGGKEVLTALLSGIKKITGIEVNPDFIEIVKDNKEFNGGIYTDFPNIDIIVKEGRHFIKQTDQKYDLLVMALPSTEQTQSIDNFAMSENFLLTVEAIEDYFKILTNEGQLILTVHNKWELVRLIVTSLKAFENIGISNKDALNRIITISDEYAPTIIIKRNAFLKDEVERNKLYMQKFPSDFPMVSFYPYGVTPQDYSIETELLNNLYKNRNVLSEYIENNENNITPVFDDSPYFYKVKRGIPSEYLWLLFGSIMIGLISILGPKKIILKKTKKITFSQLKCPLLIFICIGLGFMIIEISLFQKLILYLGSPTIALAILLSSLLIGMGIGSYYGKKIYANNPYMRLKYIVYIITILNFISIFIYPKIFNNMLEYNQTIRAFTVFISLIPLGFFLGIPFPTGIEILAKKKMDNLVPWMYGINGIMSIIGSILTVVLSMLIGFTFTNLIGVFFYMSLLIIKEKELI